MPIRLVRLGALVVAGVVAYFGMLAILGFRLRDFSRRAVL
jgi:putative peptidoglycan lipid II flippase